MKQRLAICIPVYNQPHYLHELLESYRGTGFVGADIFVVDDHSNLSYNDVLTAFKDLPISYSRNTSNLGALQNMQHAFSKAAASYDYVMVMHEDDLFAPNFFSEFLQVISAQKPDLIMSGFREFVTNSGSQQSHPLKSDTLSKKDLALKFLQLMPIAFGSAIFNTQTFPSIDLNLSDYGEFADRPFLLSKLKQDSVIILNNQQYLYRSHHESDRRWNLLKPTHVFNALECYRVNLKNNITSGAFRKFATSFLRSAIDNLILSKRFPGYVSFYVRAFAHRFLSIKYLLLQHPRINRTATVIKNKRTLLHCA